MHQLIENISAHASAYLLVPCPRGLAKAIINLPLQSLITPPAPHLPFIQEPSLLTLTKRMGGLIHLTQMIDTSLR